MSGFEFHLRCRACGLTSGTYPDRYDVSPDPQHLILPAVDRAAGRFDRARIAISGEPLDEDQIRSLAAGHSTADVTVCVRAALEGPSALAPHVTCPRCRQDAVETILGSAPRPRYIAVSIDQVVTESRAAGAGSTAAWHLEDRGVEIRVSHRASDDSTLCWWTVQRSYGVAPDRADLDGVAAELIAALTAAGGVCGEPTRLRAFTRFSERRP